jgi:hypothetical protein
MGKDEEGEWGEPFDEADRPRRDRVPEPGFSRPSDVTADPELTLFVPSFRAKRRRVARSVTFVVLAAVGTMVARLAWWAARVGDTDERRQGIVSYLFVVACLAAGLAGIRQVWRWAGAPDPADARRPH